MITLEKLGSFTWYARRRFALSSMMMLIGVTACTAGQAPPSVAPPPASSQSSSASSSVAVSQPTLVPTLPVAPTVAAPTATQPPTKASAPAASPTLAKSFKGFRLPDGDSCKLLAQADVEKVLGKPIKSTTVMNDQNSGAKGCFYQNEPGKSFVSLTYWQGDNAKLQLLDSIAQLQQKGCSISNTGTTRRVTPTPLPPAVDALKTKSLVELFGIANQLRRDKCPPGGQEFSGLGEAAVSDSMMPVLSVVAGEVYASFLLVDSDLTLQKQIDGVRWLAAGLFK